MPVRHFSYEATAVHQLLNPFSHKDLITRSHVQEHCVIRLHGVRNLNRSLTEIEELTRNGYTNIAGSKDGVDR